MTESPGGIEQRLAELRKAFDEGFAEPPSQPAQGDIDLALIVAGGQRYALRISELAGLEAKRKIVPVAGAPGDLPGLLGLSAVRGRLVPVFDLASLLGAPARGSTPGWLALYRGQELLGLAFEEFEGTRRVAVENPGAEKPAPGASLEGPRVIRLDSGLIHLLELSAVTSRISRQRSDGAAHSTPNVNLESATSC